MGGGPESSRFLVKFKCFIVSNVISIPLKLNTKYYRQTATHETSYLPFLFPSLEQSTDPSPSERPKGRRAFNKKGEEIAEVCVFPSFFLH